MIAARGTARERILEQSFLLFLARGFDATSMSDIVRATGMSKGAVYHHFTSKDELFSAAIRRYFVDVVAEGASGHEVGGFADEVRATAAALTDALSHAMSLGADTTAYYRFLSSAIDRRRSDVQHALDARRARLSEAAERDARNGARRHRIAPGVLAKMALTTIEGAALLASVDEPGHMADHIDDAVEQFLSLVRAAER